MARFTPGVPIDTTTPTILVDEVPAPGDYKFELVVLDQEGNESAPATAVVSVKEPAREPQPRTGAMSGIVLDRLTRRPLGGVRITVQGTAFGAITAPTGTFTISNIAPGSYTVLATFGPRRSGAEVIVTAGTTAGATIVL